MQHYKFIRRKDGRALQRKAYGHNFSIQRKNIQLSCGFKMQVRIIKGLSDLIINVIAGILAIIILMLLIAPIGILLWISLIFLNKYFPNLN